MYLFRKCKDACCIIAFYLGTILLSFLLFIYSMMFGSPWGQPFAIIFPLMIAFTVGIINFIIGVIKDVRNSTPRQPPPPVRLARRRHTILPVVTDAKSTNNFDRPPLQSEICKSIAFDQPSQFQSKSCSKVFTVGRLERSHSTTINHDVWVTSGPASNSNNQHYFPQ